MDTEIDLEKETELATETSTETAQEYVHKILLWEDDESRRAAALEFLTDLLSGAEITAVSSEEEALEALDADDWEAFVVDFMNEEVSASEFVKRANNYPAAIVVAISLAFLELEDRDSLKLEQVRRLFVVEKAQPSIRS